MSDLHKAQEMMAAAVAAKQNADPELTSVTQLLKSLDRASKNVRTFGISNSVAQRFFDQFYSELTTHLTQYNVLTFVVQRDGLFLKEELVYGSQTGDVSDNLAFKLYSDGIREITFHQGIEEGDVLFFFDALWDTVGAAGSEDDDIVTRLWAKNLPTLTVVTADEVMKISELDDVLAPQGNAPLDSSLREIIAEAKAKESHEKKDQNNRVNKLSSGITGYEVSEQEMAALAKEIGEETARDHIFYILDVLTAILSSERSPELLLKLFEAFESILKTLLQGGHWTIAENVIGLLSNAGAVRPDLTDIHMKKLEELFDFLGSTEAVSAIEQYLNKTDNARTDGLPAILLTVKPTAVPTLCVLLGNLERPPHQTIVSNAIFELGKDSPESVTRHLSDRRPAFVKNLLAIITRWNDPRVADQVERILRYPDPAIRREVIRTLAVLKPSGPAVKWIPLLNDADEGVRLAALKSLLTGNYTAPFTTWEALVTAEAFTDRPPAERRNIFHAMRATAGDEAVPFWTGLLTEWGWTNRKKREELALMAVDALGKLGTEAARAALDTGTKKGTAAVKQACVTALAGAGKHLRAV